MHKSLSASELPTKTFLAFVPENTFLFSIITNGGKQNGKKDIERKNKNPS